MSYINGTARKQTVLFPATLDEYIDEQSAVRAIDAFIEYLRFDELGFVRGEPAETGRPGYDPRVVGNIHLGPSERSAVVAAVGAGGRAQRGGDVVERAVSAGPQDALPLSPRQPPRPHSSP